jgi:hypothetical protein
MAPCYHAVRAGGKQQKRGKGLEIVRVLLHVRVIERVDGMKSRLRAPLR